MTDTVLLPVKDVIERMKMTPPLILKMYMQDDRPIISLILTGGVFLAHLSDMIARLEPDHLIKVELETNTNSYNFHYDQYQKWKATRTNLLKQVISTE